MDLDLLPVAALDCDAEGYVRAANTAASTLFATEPAVPEGAALARLSRASRRCLGVLRPPAGRSCGMHARRANRVPFTAEVRVAAHAGGPTLVVTEVRTFEEPAGAYEAKRRGRDRVGVAG